MDIDQLMALQRNYHEAEFIFGIDPMKLSVNNRSDVFLL